MIKKSSKKGFSLVELLVVITIIAILSVVAYTAVGGNTVKARDAKRKQDLGTIQQALEIYYAEKGVYPSALLYSATTYPLTKKHLSDIPTDPAKGTAYFYTVNGTNEYELAAALEVDGNPSNFASYVIGNAANPITKTVLGVSMRTGGTGLTSCTSNHLITKGTIGGSDADGNCIPYDPRP